MKHVAYIKSLLLMLLCSCSDDVQLDSPGTDVFRLVVNVPQEASSRAYDSDTPDSEGSRAVVSELNEFKVKSLHFYFYPSGSGDDVASLYDYVWTGEFDTQETVNVPLPNKSLFEGGIFGADGTTCIVYAVANVDIAEGPATINDLKATAISSSFDQTGAQESFAMDGQSTVTIVRDERKAAGEIELTRAAAKLTLAIELPESVTETIINQDGTTSPGTGTYTPNAGAMRVWMGNGVKNSKLNTAPVEAAETDMYSNELTTTDGTGFTFDDSQTKYKYVQDVPFYSYPNKWDPTTPVGNSYLTVMVPWIYSPDGTGTGTEVTTTYYRLAVQPKACKIERNMHYDMRVTIGRMGSTVPQKPIDIEADWTYELPWNTHTLATDIKQIRYLLLNNNYYDSNIENPDGTKGAYLFEMDNETSIEIPVGTSHDVEIASVTMTWHDFFNNVDRKLTLTTDGAYKYTDLAGYESAKTSVYAGIDFDNGASMLKLNRDLINISYVNRARVPESYRNGTLVPEHYVYTPADNPKITTDPAFNAYNFDIMLWHKDDHNRKAYVHIVQTSAIYVTALITSSKDYRIINNSTTNNFGEELDNINGKPGWRQTTGYLSYIPYSNTDDYYMGDIWGGGKNKNTYVINITRFNADESSNYIIADPRARSVNNLPNSGSTNYTRAAAWNNNDAQGNDLDNYYPTDASSDKENFIAPQIRIASQLGATQPTTRLGAQRRCAAYQENGRPAGRWRLPTVAEIRYIAYLSSNAYIPFLFGGEEDNSLQYWCGSGAVSIDNTAIVPSVERSRTEPQRTAVRCVYDEWYWGTDTLTNKAQFVWGDDPRTTSGN